MGYYEQIADREVLYLTIYDYMEKYYAIPPLTRDNEDVVFQIIAGRTAIQDFIDDMLDSIDDYPGKILLEHEIKLETAAYHESTENQFMFHAGYVALADIDGAFFHMEMEV